MVLGFKFVVIAGLLVLFGFMCCLFSCYLGCLLLLFELLALLFCRFVGICLFTYVVVGL